MTVAVPWPGSFGRPRELEGSLIESSEGVLRWVDDDRLLELELWEGDHYFLPWLDRPEFFSAKFIYKQGRLVDHQVVFYSEGRLVG